MLNIRNRGNSPAVDRILRSPAFQAAERELEREDAAERIRLIGEAKRIDAEAAKTLPAFEKAAREAETALQQARDAVKAAEIRAQEARGRVITESSRFSAQLGLLSRRILDLTPAEVVDLIAKAHDVERAVRESWAGVEVLPMGMSRDAAVKLAQDAYRAHQDRLATIRALRQEAEALRFEPLDGPALLARVDDIGQRLAKVSGRG